MHSRPVAGAAAFLAVAALVLGMVSSAAAAPNSELQAARVGTGDSAAAATSEAAATHSHGRAHNEAAGPTAHVDPPPPGVDVRQLVSTSVLRQRLEQRQERKGQRPARRSASGAGPAAGSAQQSGEIADTAASTVPPGTSALPGTTNHVARSCAGTGSDGRRVEVLYVVEADDTDRFSAVLPLIQDEVANVDDTFALSAAKTGGSRRVRWVFTSTTTCEPTVTRVIVPAGSLGDFGSSVRALRAAGYTNPLRKYLVFADTAVLCGVGHIYRDDSRSSNLNDGNASAMFARVDTGCWQASASRGSTAAHELMHNFGAVQASAPHQTPYGHCTDRYDLMCYDDGSGARLTDVCSSSHSMLLDCRNDDYFHTSPAAGSYLATYWNSADSSFLDRSSARVASDPVAPAPGGLSTEPIDPVVPVSPPSVTVAGPRALLPGLPATLRASGSASGTYAWSVSDPDCVTGPTNAQTLNIRCAADRAGPLAATVTFTRSDGETASATSTVAATGPATRLTQTLSATRSSFRSGQPASVTAKLLHGTTPVRGRVRLLASTNRTSWRTVATNVDTGADGTTTFTLRPTRTTYLRLSTPVAPGSGWTAPAGPVARLTVERSGTKLTMAKRKGTSAALSGRLASTTTSRPLAGRSVLLQYRPGGTKKWLTVRVLKTSRTGRISAQVPRGRAAFYRWHYRGSVADLPRSSSTAWVR